MKTGIATNTIIYTRKLNPKTKNCRNCKYFKDGFCNEFKIKITDKTNAKICSRLTFRKPKPKKKRKNNNYNKNKNKK